jgi:ankyrin repeat protein
MQDGFTPAYAASFDGHTETVALLLANKADINAADEVQQLKIFKFLLLIDNELQDFNIAFFILSTILARENLKYCLTWFMLVLYAGWCYPSVYSFPKWTH